MVDADVGDHRKHRLEDVDRIVAPAHADFQHRDFRTSLPQRLHRGQTLKLERGQRSALPSRFDPGKGRAQGSVLHRSPTDSNGFGKSKERG